MKKIAIGSWAFLYSQERPTTDFHDLLHHLAHLGFDGVELSAFAPHPNPASHDTADNRARLKRMVADHGLEFAALAPDLTAHQLVSADDAGPYAAAFAEHLAFAADLGIATIRIDSAEPSAAMNRLDAALAVDRVVKTFDDCAKRAAQRGVAVAWEFDPGRALSRPAEIIEVVHRVRDLGNPNFGTLFNTAHAQRCAGDALAMLDQLHGHINHVHVIDTDGTLNEHGTTTRLPLGRGQLDFHKLIPALLAADVPSPWWTIDLGYWPGAWEAASESRQFLHRLRRKYAP